MIDSKVKGVHIESVKHRTAYKLCKGMFSNVIYYTIDDMKNLAMTKKVQLWFVDLSSLYYITLRY